MAQHNRTLYEERLREFPQGCISSGTFVRFGVTEHRSDDEWRMRMKRKGLHPILTKADILFLVEQCHQEKETPLRKERGRGNFFYVYDSRKNLRPVGVFWDSRTACWDIRAYRFPSKYPISCGSQIIAVVDC